MFSIIREKDFHAELVEEERPVLLAYFRLDCDYNDQLQVLERVSERLGEGLKICLLPENYCYEKQKVKADGVPTYIVFCKGKECGRMLGKAYTETLFAFVAEALLKIRNTAVSATDQNNNA